MADEAFVFHVPQGRAGFNSYRINSQAAVSNCMSATNFDDPTPRHRNLRHPEINLPQSPTGPKVAKLSSFRHLSKISGNAMVTVHATNQHRARNSRKNQLLRAPATNDPRETPLRGFVLAPDISDQLMSSPGVALSLRNSTSSCRCVTAVRKPT
jgi:hypothetical protein